MPLSKDKVYLESIGRVTLSEISKAVQKITLLLLLIIFYYFGILTVINILAAYLISTIVFIIITYINKVNIFNLTEYRQLFNRKIWKKFST